MADLKPPDLEIRGRAVCCASLARPACNRCHLLLSDIMPTPKQRVQTAEESRLFNTAGIRSPISAVSVAKVDNTFTF
jgi:hypothetical protein